MPTIETILSSIQTTRNEFAEAFLRAQSGLPLDDRKPFDAVARKDNDQEAFQAALEHAVVGNWLGDLVDTLIEADRSGGKLLLARMKERAEGNAEIQAITNEMIGFPDAEEVAQGHINGKRWTCRILVDGWPRGTGVLIARDQVLTAWHVVKEVFRLQNGSWNEIKGAPAV